MDLVFSGKVLQVEESNKEQRTQWHSDLGGTLEVELALDEVWKGTGKEVISVITNDHSDACGYPFTEGDSYVVFAFNERARDEKTGSDFEYFSTNSCIPNRKLDESSKPEAFLKQLEALKSKANVIPDDENSEESATAQES